ncbi:MULTISPECIES: hypothetical protein [unclassified Vibrio]|uniref:hypothetical protein n=1 Tax=unclassified Vibrio TaxID=2614977 RepID=UPI0012682459|nr:MULTISPECIES: hypothetical protein [unclassified Vibrio]QFT40052.1 hypothetical protein FIU99_27050 [Vibrio sp. THAF64]QGM37997.1 hypothetical protein GGC04_27255 [Vibrio sp. THAF191d]QGN73423.1 hypothetical protein GGC03_26920 [Vibrio sp. THAF191c]
MKRMNVTMQNGSVSIDGRSFTGRSICIIGDKVIVDGVEQAGELVGDIQVKVDGNVESLQTISGDVVANDIGSVTTTSGDVECQSITGNVKTISGDVRSRQIGGSVNTVSGSIKR